MPRAHDVVELTCNTCAEVFYQRWDSVQRRRAKGNPDACPSCSNRRASKAKWEGYTPEQKARICDKGREGVLSFLGSLTNEQRQERSRAAGSRNTSHAVQRQWDSIRSDPDKYEALRGSRGRATKAVWDAYTPEQRSARIKRMLGTRKVSARCTKFLDQVRAAGVPVEAEVPVAGFVVDGLHAASHTVILFHGDFWHCNPATYTDPSIFCGWLGRTVGEQQERDRRQLGVFYAKGYRVVVVWESTWLVDPGAEVERVARATRGEDYK